MGPNLWIIFFFGERITVMFQLFLLPLVPPSRAVSRPCCAATSKTTDNARKATAVALPTVQKNCRAMVLFLRPGSETVQICQCFGTACTNGPRSPRKTLKVDSPMMQTQPVRVRIEDSFCFGRRLSPQHQPSRQFFANTLSWDTAPEGTNAPMPMALKNSRLERR